jgi:hypothetical protein
MTMMKINQVIPRTLLLATTFAATTAHAGGPPDMNGWLKSFDIGYVWQGSTDLDNGSEFSVDRAVIELGTARKVGDDWLIGFSLGYGEDRYEFGGPSANAPWDDIRTLQLSFTMRYQASDNWNLFGLPILRYSAERDASLDDGREIGLLAGASYKFSEDLKVGPGLGVFSGIGGEEDVFPILLIDWAITDTISLETGRGLAATRGPGLTLKWKPEGKWEFGLAARYEKFRFRLADAGENIGEDKAVPVVLTAAWNWNPAISVTALAGFETSGDLSIENSNGDRLRRLSYDSAPLAGLVAKILF